MFSAFLLWARKDLNLRPADYESDALTNSPVHEFIASQK